MVAVPAEVIKLAALIIMYFVPYGSPYKVKTRKGQKPLLWQKGN